MQRLSTNTTQSINGVSGTFGTVQLAAHDQAVLIRTVGRTYDGAGILHVDASLVRLPIDAAIRLHVLLADAIVAAEEQADERQMALPAVWSDATTTAPIRSRRHA